MFSTADAAGRVRRRFTLAGLALLMLLSLALHWAADLTWLCQSAAAPGGLVSGPCASVATGSTRVAADPHGEGAIPFLPQPLADAPWLLLAILLWQLLIPAARPRLLHPPQRIATI